MGALNLTIQVRNVPPAMTAADLATYFSFCGTVDKIQLQRNKDKPQSAQVTFRQPFAFRTALLLDNATVDEQPIRVSPWEGDIKDDQEETWHDPAALHPDEAVTPGGTTNIWDRTRDMLEEKYNLSERGQELVDQACSAIHTAENAAESFLSLLEDHPYVATGLMFVSGALYEAAKYAAQVAATTKRLISSITPGLKDLQA
ncbi:uncharacterized protein LOC104422215 [Eucalyptus grandis]|uniref:uncharacterized protein LOC104422215 n=1 Tax=Eucalyptus grandis TaxID=71139 RepID=UPI00192EE323|nr:uncharacterized protein LOC104422215 [Eucalyptus grandis]